jgi:Co/Zn/Cd efflux system component
MAHCRSSAWILLNCVPEGLDMEELELRLISLMPALNSVHEMHVWTLAGK